MLDVRELRPGLWRWTARHPKWDGSERWGPDVGCVYAEMPDGGVLVDPLVPAGEEERFWSALDRDVERLGRRRLTIVLTAAWHRRSADAVAERYAAEVWRPSEPLPGGVEADVFEAGDWREVAFTLLPYAALVFGDVIEGDGAGGLRMPPDWWPREEPRTARVREELRRLIERPIKFVLVSHGDPVLEGARAALERALADGDAERHRPHDVSVR